MGDGWWWMCDMIGENRERGRKEKFGLRFRINGSRFLAGVHQKYKTRSFAGGKNWSRQFWSAVLLIFPPAKEPSSLATVKLQICPPVAFTFSSRRGTGHPKILANHRDNIGFIACYSIRFYKQHHQFHLFNQQYTTALIFLSQLSGFSMLKEFGSENYKALLSALKTSLGQSLYTFCAGPECSVSGILAAARRTQIKAEFKCLCPVNEYLSTKILLLRLRLDCRVSTWFTTVQSSISSTIGTSTSSNDSYFGWGKKWPMFPYSPLPAAFY